jgi:hypothetical protein
METQFSVFHIAHTISTLLSPLSAVFISILPWTLVDPCSFPCFVLSGDMTGEEPGGQNSSQVGVDGPCHILRPCYASKHDRGKTSAVEAIVKQRNHLPC